MTQPEKLPMFIASDAFSEIPNLSESQKETLQASLDHLAMHGSVPDEIPEVVKGQNYKMARAGDVTFVFREMSVDEVARQIGSPADTLGFMLLDLFIEDSVLRKERPA